MTELSAEHYICVVYMYSCCAHMNKRGEQWRQLHLSHIKRFMNAVRRFMTILIDRNFFGTLQCAIAFGADVFCIHTHTHTHEEIDEARWTHSHLWYRAFITSYNTPIRWKIVRIPSRKVYRSTKMNVCGTAASCYINVDEGQHALHVLFLDGAAAHMNTSPLTY